MGERICPKINKPFQHNCEFLNEGKKWPDTCCFKHGEKCSAVTQQEKKAATGMEMIRELNKEFNPSVPLDLSKGLAMWELFESWCDEEGYSYCDDCNGRSHRD